MRLNDLIGPRQLRELSQSDLQSLAAEIREVIVHTVSQTGGHLASNLGVVELTLALHSVFDSPVDKLLWDVSHQSYPHKLLTGRYSAFNSLRHQGGLSGFTNPDESEHDLFHWGHASTSISVAAGIATARDLAGESFEVVAVIGDGALTGGMTFEAINHLGQAKTKLIVVINDNGMSIAPNVGALSQILSGNRSSGIQSLTVPSTFFEELGWTYIGPVDGHDIVALQRAFRQAKACVHPVVVHASTTKGKGVSFAESMPDKYHGGGKFHPSTGAWVHNGVTYSDVFGSTLVQLARHDQRIVAVTAAMTSGTGLTAFSQELEKRFFDVGIAEEHAITFAAGLAKMGLRPVVAVYSTFLQRAFDQVVHDISLQRLPVVLAIDRAGLVTDGPTHHGVFDIAYLRCIPNCVISAPSNEDDLQHMLYTGLLHEGGAFAIRYPSAGVQGVPMSETFQAIPVGRGQILRPGRDVVILALGAMVPVALKASDILAAEGVDACVVDPRWVKPLDVPLIERLARRTGAVVTVEEGCLTGGFGSAVVELLSDRRVTGVTISRMGIPDAFIDHGDPKELLDGVGLSADGIAQCALNLVSRKRHLGLLSENKECLFGRS